MVGYDDVRYSREMLQQINEKLARSSEQDRDDDLFSYEDAVPVSEQMQEWSLTLDDVADLWAKEISYQDVTDTELEQSRSRASGISDSEQDLHRLVKCLSQQQEGLDSWSKTVDRALRIALADVIDNNQDVITRSEFDIEFYIPPVGWVERQDFDFETPDGTETIEGSGRRIDYSTPPVVFDIAETVIERTEYDHITELVRLGGEIMTGNEPTTTSTHPDSDDTQERLPISDLFDTRSKRGLIEAIVSDAETDGWHTIGDLAEMAEVSKNAIRPRIEELVVLGVIEQKNEDVHIPHYKIKSSDVVELLQSWDGYPLTKLLNCEGRRKLAEFFLTEADSEMSYSFGAISRQYDVGNQTASKHIDVLQEAGLVISVEGTRTTEYRVDTDADIVHFLAGLNQAIYTEFSNQISE